MIRTRAGASHTLRSCPALRAGRLAALAACATTLLLWAAVGPAGAQQWGTQANHVNITSARVEQLSNAVRVILQADGTLNTDVDFQQFWERGREGGWRQMDLKRFSVYVLNARSSIGRFVDVGAYPVSHVNLSVPAEAQEGVGLEVAVSLYVPARIGKIQRGDSVADWGGGGGRDDRRVDMVLSDNGRELIITVYSDFHHDVRARPAEEPVGPGQMNIEHVTDGYRLQALRAPLQLVLEELSVAARVPVSLGPGVDRLLTANLPGMEIHELLGTIARISALNLAAQNGRYHVSAGTPDDVEAYWAMESRRMQLANLPVDEALLLLPTFLLKHVRADAESNALVAFGPPELLDRMERDLRGLDQAPRQVRVRALVFEMADTVERPRILEALLEGGTTSMDIGPAEGRLRVHVRDQPLEEIQARLEAYARRSSARVQAQPEVVVLSGREAAVFVGRQQYYRFLRETWSGLRLELRRVDVGIGLTTTPWTGDGQVFTVPFSVNSDNIITRDGEGIPLVSRQSAEGSLRIERDQTLIFGGLRSRDESRQDRNVHPLDKMPIAGSLMASVARTETETDVWILIAVDDAGETVVSPEALRLLREGGSAPQPSPGA